MNIDRGRDVQNVPKVPVAKGANHVLEQLVLSPPIFLISQPQDLEDSLADQQDRDKRRKEERAAAQKAREAKGNVGNLPSNQGLFAVPGRRVEFVLDVNITAASGG